MTIHATRYLGNPLSFHLTGGQASDLQGADGLLPGPIENSFARLKQYRVIATRYDKRAANFLGAIHLAAAVIWLN